MLLLCPPSQVTFIWSQTYAHTFNAETLPYVIYTCSLNIYITVKRYECASDIAIRQILANMFVKAEWESLPFIERPLWDWYIISLLDYSRDYLTEWADATDILLSWYRCTKFEFGGCYQPNEEIFCSCHWLYPLDDQGILSIVIWCDGVRVSGTKELLTQ